MVMSTHQLQQELTGGLLLPDDPRYEQIRRGWNRTIDQRPALILLAHNAQDIALGLRYAREAGLGISVQLTGHGICLLYTSPSPRDGLLSRMPSSA